ncbi:MAG: HAD-IIIC family phosphatase [Devosia sp.]
MNSTEILLVSDFNVEPLARVMANTRGLEMLRARAAPFGQVYQQLARGSGSLFIWTRPEGVLPAFARAANFEEVDHALVLDEVDAFANAILTASSSNVVFVASWRSPTAGYGLLEWRPGLGLQHLVAAMNARLADCLEAASNVFLLDSSRWLRGVAKAESATMWYATKSPFVTEVLKNASEDVARACAALRGESRRLIVLDLDETLWGGVVGETGWQGLRLGGHDYIGEAFKDFQRALRGLSNRGVQLAIVSKNDEAVALEAIDEHPEMLIRRSDLAGWRINWNDKAGNVAALIDELNLGPKSVVFLDDSPAERDRVRQALPDVLVPDWPKSVVHYVDALRALDCFDTATLSKEDRARKSMYVADRVRREVKGGIGSLDEWLQKIGTCVTVVDLTNANIGRSAQLLNKTNQLNLSTRRLNEQELWEWVSDEERRLQVVSAADNFGDMGIVGLFSIERHGETAKLVDFVLSCRAMGRKIEEAMFYLALEHTKRMGAVRLEIEYLPTPRNGPTLAALAQAGVRPIANNRYELRIDDGYSLPSVVELRSPVATQ